MHSSASPSPAKPTPQDLFTVAEAADYLRIHPKTAYRLIRERAIRVVMLSTRGTRITRKVLEAYVANLEAEQNRPAINPAKLARAKRNGA
jgi:excisionase family DNA binding protein